MKSIAYLCCQYGKISKLLIDPDSSRFGQRRHSFLRDIIHYKICYSVVLLGGLLTLQALFPAAAQTGDEGVRRGIEEIIVTATKRAESLQDISVPVTALSNERIVDSGINYIEDLQYYVPNITVANTFGLTRVFMRGLGDNNTAENLDPPVTFYIDGVVLSPRGGQSFSFFDLERLEILRGPQGTLYGRNSTGGAVTLVTSKPTEEFEAYARVKVGDFSLTETEGALSGPLSDRLQGRFAWKTISRNGFGINEFTGNDIDDENMRAVRTSLAFQPTNNIDFLLMGEYAKQDNAAFSLKFADATFPNTPSRAPIGAGGFAEKPRDLNTEFDPDNDREKWYLTGIVEWQVNDSLSVKNTLSYQEVDYVLFHDLDFSSVVNRADVTGNPTSNLQFTVAAEQITEELQFTYDDEVFGRRLRAIAGFFYFSEDVFNGVDFSATPTSGIIPGGGVGGPKRVQLSGDGEADAWALYWNVNYDIAEKLTLKLGGRFSREEKSIFNEATIVVANGLGPQITLPPETDEATFNDYTPEVGLEWRPTNNMLLYYTYSEGFKAGSGELASTGTSIIKPESIRNNEFGLKSSWFGNQLIINVAGYFYEMDNAQLRFSFPQGLQGLVVAFDNATTLDTHGIELDFSWAATERLTLSGSGAWTHARYGPFAAVDQASPDQFLVNPTSPLFDPTVSEEDILVDVGGNNALGTPEWQWSLHGEYDIPLANGGMVTAFADVSWKDETWHDIFNNERLREGAYTIVDARLRYTSPGEHWTVDIWGKNLTDELVATVISTTSLSNSLSRTFLPPRTWGATVGFRY